MVLVSEIVNVVWIAVSLACAAAGYVLFSFAGYSFWRIAVGMPLGLGGAGLFLFKSYELFLVIVDPTRIRLICKFCRGNIG